MATKQKSARIIVHPATIEYYNSKKVYVPVKAYSIAELAVLYDVCPRTLNKWMKPFKAEIGDRMGRFFTVHQVKVIFDKLDVPHLMDVA